MAVVNFLIVVLVLCAVVVIVGGPLHRTARDGTDGDGAPAEEAARAVDGELAAEREAKLREIRDAELDWRTGKLSEQDWRILDASLRAEASELLKAEGRSADRSSTDR